MNTLILPCFVNTWFHFTSDLQPRPEAFLSVPRTAVCFWVLLLSTRWLSYIFLPSAEELLHNMLPIYKARETICCMNMFSLGLLAQITHKGSMLGQNYSSGSMVLNIITCLLETGRASDINI